MTEKPRRTKKQRVTMLQNVKHDKTLYKVGDSVELDAGTAKMFVASGFALSGDDFE